MMRALFDLLSRLHRFHPIDYSPTTHRKRCARELSPDTAAQLWPVLTVFPVAANLD